MIIRLADCPSTPWKNGLGRSREIAVYPLVSSSDNFEWRASVAEVDSDAPFSRFPGIARHIVLLDGAGFSMTLNDDHTHALTTPFAPFAFPGEAAVAVKLADGATRDFNLMVRRTAGRGELTVWSEPGTHRLPALTALVYVGAGTIDIGGQPLQAGDSWCARGVDSAPQEIVLGRGATVLVVRVLTPA